MYSSKITEKNANCNPTFLDYLERKPLIRASMERMHALGFSLTPPYVKGQTKGQTEKPWGNYQFQRADLNKIGWWTTRYPGQNYGIITGAISGIVGLDTDDPEAEALLQDRCPPTPVKQHSGSGRGTHQIYRHPGFDVANVVKLIFRGKQYRLDVRGEGGLLVGPGCYHPVTGGIYTEFETWTPALIACAPVFDPGWLEIDGQRIRPKSPEAVRSDFRGIADDLDGLNANQQAGRDWLANCPGAVQGKGRGADNYAYGLAVELLWAFDLTPEEGFPVLFEWGQKEGTIDAVGGCWPWTEKEIWHKLTDAAAEINEDQPRGHRLPSSCYEEQVAALLEKQKVNIDERPAGDLADNETAAPTAPQPTGPQPTEPAEEPRLFWTWNEYKEQAAKETTTWLVDGLLETGGINIMSGQSYAGKTVIAMHMVGAILLADEWFNHFCKTVPVLYFNHDVGKIKRVIGHLTRQRDAEVFDTAANKWWTPIRHDYLFENLTPAFVNQCVVQVAKQFRSLYNEDFTRPLVIIDTFRSAFMGGMDSGAEIDAPTMFNVLRPFHKWVKTMKTLNATILILHHNNRGADEYAGSGALPNLTDSLWNYRQDPHNRDPHARLLTIKGRDSFSEIQITYDPLYERFSGTNAGAEAKTKLHDDIVKSFEGSKIISEAFQPFASRMTLKTFQKHHAELVKQGRLIDTGAKGGRNKNAAVFLPRQG